MTTNQEQNQINENDFEWVDVEASSPAPCPENINYGAREWDDWVVDPKVSIPFQVNGIFFYINNTPDPIDKNNILQKMKNHGQCNACTERARKFAFLIGEDGSAFMNTIRHPNDGWHSHSRGSVNAIRKDIVEVNKSIQNPSILIVKEGCFPQIDQGFDFGDVVEISLTPHSPGIGLKSDGNIKPFKHVTIQPSNYTSVDLTTKWGRLIMEYYDIIHPRLEKLCIPEAIDSVIIIENNLDKLERPNHWKSVINWVKDVQNYFATFSKSSYNYLSDIEKTKLAIYAITSPQSRVEITDMTVVHKSYKQASNIVDFITLGSIEDVLKEMDIRSDPNHYMVSQLARQLADHKVESKHRISLVWSTRDDLDLHVRPEGCSEISFGNKVVIYNRHTCKLDFDMGVQGNEINPCENVTACPGTFHIMVNNYTRRTNADVPFTIIIHQDGKEDHIINLVWPWDRRCHDKMSIINWTFTDIVESTPVMGVNQANRARQLNSKWEEYIGNPISSIPCVEELNIPVNIWEKNNNSTQEQVNGIDYMDMVNATARKEQIDKTQSKKFLSQIENEKKPDTLTKLLTYMSTGKHTLEINTHNYTPSYLTEISTRKDILKCSYILNHYNSKFQLPGKPIQGSSNARFDSSWFKTINYHKAVVDSFVQIDNYWFMIINDTKLPESNSDFPLGGGFYPTMLNADVHDLRDRWSFCNTTIQPKVMSNGTPVIGSILTCDTATFILDGNPITVLVK